MYAKLACYLIASRWIDVSFAQVSHQSERALERSQKWSSAAFRSLLLLSSTHSTCERGDARLSLEMILSMLAREGEVCKLETTC